MSDETWGTVLICAPELVAVVLVAAGVVVEVVGVAIRYTVGMWIWRRRAWPRRIS